LQSAIDDQLKEGRGCPLSHCAFKEEIGQAILESKTPEVVIWDVDKKEIIENENIILSWEVRYAKNVTISGLGEVSLKGSKTITPHTDTMYSLTIQDYKDNIYEIKQPIDVRVMPLPTIQFFSNKTRFETGDSIVLSWTHSHTTKIEIIDKEKTIDVSDLTDYTTRATEKTTMFKLIATALDHKTTIEKEISIEVFPKPQIQYFKVSPEVALNSMPVKLSWKVKNAKEIKVNNGVGVVNAEGEKESLYRENTLYTITAIGELSTVTKDVVVKIFPTPIIESLKVPMPDFNSRIKPINITAPQINLKISLPNFVKPNVELSRIRPFYKRKSIFNFFKIYEYVKRKSGIL
jgi:hypothetical protein